MRKTGFLLLFFFYFVGFINLNAAVAIGPVAKYEVTHAHEHGSEHEHQHHHDDENSAEPAQKNPHGDVPHTHEIVSGPAFFLVPNQVQTVVCHAVELDSTYLMRSEDPRPGPTLYGIFRPPIA